MGKCEKRKRRVRRWQMLFVLTIFMMFLVPKKAEAASAAETVTINYLVENMNISPAAACGLMASMYDESRLIPNISSPDGLYYGICQWSRQRAANMRSYCARNGLDSTSLTGQLSFAIYETRTTMPGLYSYLQSLGNTASDAASAAYQWVKQYERPYNISWFGSRRAGIAAAMFSRIGGEAIYADLSMVKDGIRVTWTGGGNGTFAVRRSNKAGGPWKTIARVKGRKKYTDTSVKSGKTYYYIVSSVSSSGKIQHSSSRRSIKCVIRKYLTEKGSCRVSLSRNTFIYTGKACKPKVSVRWKNKKLKAGRDYTVSYTNNVNAGRAKAVITGTGKYAGTVKVSFRIRKAEQKIKASNISVTYRKGAVITVRVSAAGSIRLKSNNTSVASVSGQTLKLKKTGSAVITITASGTKNYKAAVRKIKLKVRASSKKTVKKTAGTSSGS